MTTEYIGELRGTDVEKDNKGVRKCSRKFEVQSDTTEELQFAVLATAGLPALYDEHPENSGMLVERLRAEQMDEDPYRWTVTADYSSQTVDPDKTVENPLERAPVIRWGQAKYQKAVDRDAQGAAYLNSAGDPFDPPRELSRGKLTLSIEKNIALEDYSAVFNAAFWDTVNDDTFLGFPAGTVKCGSITADSQQENGLIFWRVRYEFEIDYTDEWGWNKPILDRGFNYVVINDDGTTTKFLVRDGEGAAASSPALLNGVGALLSESYTTLTSDLLVAGTTAGVTSTVGYPPAPFKVRFTKAGSSDSEVVLVGDVPDDTTLGDLTRAQDGTTAVSWYAADDVTVRQEPYYLQYQDYAEADFSLLDLE